MILGPVVARPAASVLGLGPRLLRGQTGRLARRNAMRDPRRTSASASALMVGTAVVALFTTFGASIKATIEHTVDQDFGGDLIIVTDDFSGAGLSPAVAEEVAALPEVAVSAGMSNAVITADGGTVEPSVVEPAALGALLDLGVSEGSLDDLAAGHIAVSERYADDHDLDDRQHRRRRLRRRVDQRTHRRRDLFVDDERRRHDHDADRLGTARRAGR